MSTTDIDTRPESFDSLYIGQTKAETEVIKLKIARQRALAALAESEGRVLLKARELARATVDPSQVDQAVREVLAASLLTALDNVHFTNGIEYV